jgi:hypothetical protein
MQQELCRTFLSQLIVKNENERCGSCILERKFSTTLVFGLTPRGSRTSLETDLGAE